MFISKEEYERRLSSPRNLGNTFAIERCGRGRNPGDTNKTAEERAIIGADARILGATQAAEIHDCSVSQAHSYAKGQTSTTSKGIPRGANQELEEAVDSKILQVKEAAVDKILETMGYMTGKKLEDTVKITDLAAVASAMTKVASIGTRKDLANQTGPSVNIVIMSPPVKDRESYDIVDVNRVA